MKIYKCIAVVVFTLALAACGMGVGNDTVSLSGSEARRYDLALENVQQVEKLCKRVILNPKQETIVVLLEQAKKLEYDYNSSGMNKATRLHCDSLKMRVDICKERAMDIAEKLVVLQGNIPVLDVREKLMDEAVCYPVYMKRGETLFCNIEASAMLKVKFYNADMQKLMVTYTGRNITDSLKIANTGVYLLEVIPQEKLYVSVAMGYRPTKPDDIYNRPSINAQQVECEKGDIGAKLVQGIGMRKCFEEPRKFTLRGQLKAVFSGNAKALVALHIPAGATDILYSLRVATSESSRPEDGRFHDNLSRSYSRVKFLGLPLYEKTSSNGLLNTLLDDNRPVREEDAYCNMYVFRNQAQAKLFQDGAKPASQLNYDVDYSTVGTQSCNGRIPVNGARTIYLGFENERMRYTNYLWIEAEAVVPNKLYYTTKYTID